MKRKRSIIGLAAVFGAAAALAVGTASAGAEFGDAGNQLAGAWTVTVHRPAPLPPLVSLQVFTADGGVVETASEAPASRTAQFGSWERVSGRLYASTGWMLRFDPQTGAQVATMKIKRNIRVSDDGQSFEQAARATTYDLNGTVIASFPVVATGERMEIERIPDEP